MNREVQIKRDVKLQADNFYTKAEQLANICINSRGDQSGMGQIRGLENVTNSTLKYSDILDYVKKHSDKNKLGREFSDQLLAYLQENIRLLADTIIEGLPPLSDDYQKQAERQRISVMLARELIGQLAVHFEYRLGRK